MCAAIFLALAMIFSLTMTKRRPAIVAEREPPVPSPKNTASVSPWMYLTSFGIDAEPVAQHLLERGLVALALLDRSRRRTSPCRARSKRISAPSKLGRRGPLDGVGDADAAQLAALARLPRARFSKPAAVGQLQRLSMFSSNSPQS